MSTSATTERLTERVSRLADAIVHHKRAYYAGRPEIADSDYDRLEDELRRIAPDHPALAMVGAEVVSTGAAKVAHAVPMLSLQKTYDESELFAWAKGHAVVGMWKIDGNSLSLVYERGRLTLAKTRGNGQLGEDVTDKIRWVGAVRARLDAAVDCEIRGELYCSEDAFLKLADEMTRLGLERPTSPRNIVAGLLGRKEHIDLNRFFGFMAFDVIGDDATVTRRTEMVKFEWLGGMGFELPRPRLLRDETAMREYLTEVRHTIDEGDVGLDGAVFSYDDTALHRELGNTSHHPRAKMSFKWAGETARTRVVDIEWATSRLGFVTPVAVVEPVFLSGATITNITLHNAAHVKAYDLKRGDLIEIIRSGEVIPKFLAVIEAAAGSFAWPSTCPSCGGGLEFDDVRLKCVAGGDCPAQRLRSILNYIQATGIDDLSEKRLEQMMDAGLVRAIPDLYRVGVDDLLTLPQVKDKLATKLFANIQATKSLPLARFLQGLGIEGAGMTTWEKLLERWPTLEELLFASPAEIAAVEGFAEKSSRQIAEGLAAKHDLIEGLLAVGVTPVGGAAATADGPLIGKTVAITGTLSRPRGEIESAIKAAGGHPASSVSKNTFAVITADPSSGSSKMVKARELGVLIWSEDDFWKIVRG